MKKAIFIPLLCGTMPAFAQQFLPFNARETTPSPTPVIAAVGADGAEIASPPPPEDYLHVTILGLGGITDLTEKQSLGGNLALGAYVAFMGHNNDDVLVPRHGLYAMFNARAGNTTDTAVTARTFLFPNISKRDFTLGYEWFAYTDDHYGLDVIPFAEFSWSRNNLFPGTDSSDYFHSFNAMAGLKLNFHRTFEIGGVTRDFGFSLHPYYQLISVQPKDFSKRDMLLGEYNLPPTFHTLGIHFSLQVAELGLFANYKYVLNSSDNIINNDLKGGTLVIGALVSTDIFSF